VRERAEGVLAKQPVRHTAEDARRGDMECNVGSADRIVRVVVGLVLLALGIFAIAGGAWKWVLIIVGLVALVTGLSGRCGLYIPFKINTCKVQGAEK
jgi:hypothetical protein